MLEMDSTLTSATHGAFEQGPSVSRSWLTETILPDIKASLDASSETCDPSFAGSFKVVVSFVSLQDINIESKTVQSSVSLVWIIILQF